MRNKHHFKIRDASPDSQPKILTSLVRENLREQKAQKEDRFLRGRQIAYADFLIVVV